MKKFILLFFIPIAFAAKAQVGIGTATPKSTLDINGSVSNKVTTITTSVTLDINNAIVLCNNASPITVTLPSAATIAGRVYTIKNINTSTILISPAGGQTIDGATSASISSQYDEEQLISDGSNWYVLNKKTGAHYIGESFGGGLIFYLDATGNHGLIAATSDQSTGVKWNNSGPSAGAYFDAQLQGIYAGEANTYFVISFNAGTYAASICYNLVLNTFSDWYLPSVDELNLMYRNLHLRGLGNFFASDVTVYYWTSTAFSNTNEGAYAKGFTDGQELVGDISDLNRVRAIRAF